FATIQRSLGRLRDLEAMATDGRFDTLSKKEIARNEKERRKLQKNLEGIRGMSRLPDAVFVVDTKKEQIAVDEARKLKIPIIGVHSSGPVRVLRPARRPRTHVEGRLGAARVLSAGGWLSPAVRAADVALARAGAASNRATWYIVVQARVALVGLLGHEIATG